MVYGAALVSGCEFDGNYAKHDADDFGGNGAGVAGSKKVTKCTFKNNVADFCGGAISYVDDVIECDFENNRAADGGAADWVKNVVNCNFKNNYAEYIGGAICDVNYVYGCNFISNSVLGKAKQYYMGGGGAIYARNKLTIDKCVFKNNKATTSGAAIFIFDSTKKIVVKNCVFKNNVATGKFETVGYLFKNYSNGVIYQMGTKEFKIYIKNCKGIGKNTKKIFKMKTKIVAKHKGGILTVKLADKIHSNPLKGLKVKIKINKKVYKRVANKKGLVKFSTKKFLRAPIR